MSTTQHCPAQHADETILTPKRLGVTEAFCQGFLESLGISPEEPLKLIPVDGDNLLPAQEHLHYAGNGVTYIRESFFSRIIDNTPLFCCVVAHELYHLFSQGFGSYGEALDLIQAFSSSDMVRADVEADLVTYKALQKEFALSFEQYCETVMLPSSDLFGVQNKSFADFARFCSRLFTLYGSVGEHQLDGGMIHIACGREGWRQKGDYHLIPCQIVSEKGVMFQSIEVPSYRLDQVIQLFWHQGVDISSPTVQAGVYSPAKVGVLLDFIAAATTKGPRV